MRLAAAEAAAGVGECLLAPINVPDVVEAVGRLLHAASPPDLAARQAVGVGPRTRQPPTPTRCLLLILRKPPPVRRPQDRLAVVPAAQPAEQEKYDEDNHEKAQDAAQSPSAIIPPAVTVVAATAK